MNVILTSLIDTEQNYSLPNGNVESTIFGTTSINGNRTRKTCGFFTPQIHFTGLLHPKSAEFVARSIRRNKAEYIRTNKASRFIAVVEALPRLNKGNGNLFTNSIKRTPQMKSIQTPTYTANSGTNSPIAFTFNNGGNA